jgi:hypothetical protein
MDITYSPSGFLLLFICCHVWSNFLAGRQRAYFKDTNRQQRNRDGYRRINGARKNINERGRRKKR